MSHLDVVERIEYDDLIFVQQLAHLRLEVAPQLLLLLGVGEHRVPPSRHEVVRLVDDSDYFPLFLLSKKVENYVLSSSFFTMTLMLTSRNSRIRLVVVVLPLLGIPVITTRGISVFGLTCRIILYHLSL